MHLRRLTRDHLVADQLSVQDMKCLAERGIRSILNNRPDGEAADQPSHVELQEAAQRAGLTYRYAPINTKAVTDAELAANHEATEALPRPLCAFCRTGTRASICWGLMEIGKRAIHDIVETVVGAGFPDEDLREQLGERTQRQERNHVS